MKSPEPTIALSVSAEELCLIRYAVQLLIDNQEIPPREEQWEKITNLLKKQFFHCLESPQNLPVGGKDVLRNILFSEERVQQAMFAREYLHLQRQVWTAEGWFEDDEVRANEPELLPELKADLKCQKSTLEAFLARTDIPGVSK